MCFFLLAKKNNGARGEDFFAKMNEVAEPFVLTSRAKTHKFLGQRRDRLIGAIDEEADWPIEAEADEAVHARRHSRGEEHRLSRFGDGG